jgi:hypothetical protein
VAEVLEPELLRRAFEVHGLLFGTAHGFQGEERDIMLLSLAVDSKTGSQTLRYLEKPDVFNVSMTRARQEQHVYCSAATANLPSGSLLGRFLEHAAGGGMGEPSGAKRSARDSFACEVIAALKARGLQAREGHEVAGLTIDVLAVAGDQALGIDLVGYPGRFHEIFPFERYRMFFRAGLQILPLGYVEWTLRREECLEAILRRMMRNGEQSRMDAIADSSKKKPSAAEPAEGRE